MGLIIRTAIQPLPNLEWHWRWPKEVAPIDHPNFKKYMSEIVFMRYWRFACIPGVYGGIEDMELNEEGRTAMYVVSILMHNVLYVTDLCTQDA